MFAEYHTHEMVTARELMIRNALKFGASHEVDSQEGLVQVEGLELAPPNYSEVWAPQVELNRAIREKFIHQHPLQRPRTKLLFDVRIYYPFLY